MRSLGSCVLVFLLTVGPKALAADLYWNNASSGSWNTPANWTPPSVPTSQDNVFIIMDGTYTVSASGNISANQITLGGTSGLATLGTTTSLTISGPSTIGDQGRLFMSGTVVSGGGSIFNAGTITGAMTGGYSVLSDTVITTPTSVLGGRLTFAKGFVNEGLIIVNDSSFNVQSGKLINAPGGTIRAQGTSLRWLNAELDNQGTVLALGYLVVEKTSAHHVNSGLIDVSSTGPLVISNTGAGADFTNSGSIAISSGLTMTVSGGRFVYSGGTLNGPGTLSLSGTVVDCDTVLTNNATISATNSEINGPIENLGTLIVKSSNVIRNGFVNNGLLECTNTNTLEVKNGLLTNAPGGILRSTGTSGFTVLTGNLLNQGTVEVIRPLILLDEDGGGHQNEGTISVNGANLTIDQSEEGGPFVNAGTITLAATRNLLGNNGIGTFVNDADGVIQGTGTFRSSTFDFSNLGRIHPGTSPGTLRFNGGMPLESSSVIHIEIGGSNPGTNHDLLTISAGATLAGTLEVSLLGGFVPFPGDSFTVVTYGSHSGAFDAYEGMSLGNDLYFVTESPSLNTGGVTLTVVEQSWTPLFPSGTPPSARAGHSAVYDAAENRMIVFGGRSDTGLLSDTWVLSDANGMGGVSEWEMLSPAGNLPPGREGHSAVHDALENRMIVFGGSTDSIPEVLSDVWVLEHVNGLGGTPAWSELPTSGGPGARNGHVAVYNASSQRMVVFGGSADPEPCASGQNDAWVLEHANGLGGSPVWIELTPTGVPPQGRAAHSASYSEALNRMTVFGGAASCSSSLDDAWVLIGADGTEATPQWAPPLAYAAYPVARQGSSQVYHPGMNRVLLFGGETIASGEELDEVLLLTHANGLGGSPGWVGLPTPATAPDPRTRHPAVFDGSSGRMIVFGGEGDSGRLGDLWVLDLQGGPGELLSAPEVPEVVPAASLSGVFSRPPSPNPTQAEVSFAVAVNESETADISVFDVQGHRVSVLHQGRLEPGEHKFVWTGRHGNGQELPAGIYWLRYESETRSDTRRIVRLR